MIWKLHSVHKAATPRLSIGGEQAPSTVSSYYVLGSHAEALELCEQALAFCRRVLPADQPDMTIVLSALVAVLTPPASYWFALEELRVLRCQFSASQHLMIRSSLT
jgi:hypothetical protein